MKTQKFDRLNLLRIISFLMVFFLHAKLFIPISWNDNVNLSWIIYTPAWAAVWIFFILSGYGIGAGFYSGKYKLSAKGIMKFYYSRIIKILPLYWTYIVLIVLFLKPRYLLLGQENLWKIIKLLLFCYQEEFDSIEFGLAWYLTTLIRLYLIAPLIFCIFKRYFSCKKYFFLRLICILLFGFISRIAMGYHIEVSGIGNWSSDIYKPFYFNLDLFCSGFIINELKQRNTFRFPIIKIIPWIVFFSLVLYNSYIYYFATYYGTENINIYCYILPSIYLIQICFMIFNYEILPSTRLGESNTCHYKTQKKSIIDTISQYIMPLYLFHSTVLLCMQNGFDINWYLQITNILNIPDEYCNFTIGMLFTFISLLYTFIFAVILYNVIMVQGTKLLDTFCKTIYKKITNL